MNGRDIYELQKKFTKIHIPLIIVLIIYISVQGIDIAIINPKYLIISYVFPLICEIIVLKKDFFHNFKFLISLRYYELCLISISIILAINIYFMSLVVLTFILLYIEFLTLFDFSEPYFRVISIACATLPSLISIIIIAFVRSSINEILFIQAGVILAISFAINYSINIYFKYYCKVEEKLFEQNRIVNSFKETNDELRINQEKVKRVNEELCYQKVKLEAAYKKINSTNAEIMIQNQIVKYISSSLNIGRLMSLITESILNEMGYDVCAISLNANIVDNKKIIYKIKTRFSEEYVEDLSNKIEENCFLPYLENKVPFIDNHVEEDKYSFANTVPIGSVLIAPLIQEDMQIGFLFVGHSKYNAFLDNTFFFEGIVAQFIIALNNAKLYSKMESMAIHDALTGIYNRGHLSKLLEEYVNETISNNTTLTLALFDIDKFKNVNDTYGHLFGDEVIKIISKLAQDIAIENNGFVARYGGEEFVIVFPGKNLKEAYMLVEQLHKVIKEKEMIRNNEVVHINVSFGITSYPETCKNPHELLNRADWAMYYSKQNGRGQITIDSDEIRENVMLK